MNQKAHLIRVNSSFVSTNNYRNERGIDEGENPLIYVIISVRLKF